MSSLTSAVSPAEIVARAAKTAYDASQLLDASERTKALVALKSALSEAKQEILAANAVDIAVSHFDRPADPLRYDIDVMICC